MEYKINSMNLIEKNIKALEKNTFMYLFHERSFFDLKKFYELMNEIRKSKNKEYLLKIIHQNNYIKNSFISHFRKDDLFEIENFKEVEVELSEIIDELDKTLYEFIKNN